MTLSTSALLIFAVQAATNSLVCGGDSTEVRWAPSLPDEGAVIQLIVAPATTSSTQLGAIVINGAVSDQPLHFEADGSGCYRALAPVPVGSPDTLVVALSIERLGGEVEHISTNIPVGRISSGILELNVDPRFVYPPASELPRIQREREMVVAVSRASHDTPRLWTRSFLRPRSSRITTNFGQRRQFNGETRSLHLGVDLAGATGTPVIASNRGVVVIVHDFYYAGNAIHLDHGNGLTTAYLHLSETTVAVGDTVARGEVIGKIGATGRVTGPHLHWHTKYGLLTVNPLTLLDVDAVTEATDRGPRSR